MSLHRFGSTLAEVEREHILETLACCNGNRTRAAKFLDISIRCLRMKLHQFGQSGRAVLSEARHEPANELHAVRDPEPCRSSRPVMDPRSAESRPGLPQDEAEALRALLRKTEAADLFAPSVRQRIGDAIATASRAARANMHSVLGAERDPLRHAA